MVDCREMLQFFWDKLDQEDIEADVIFTQGKDYPMAEAKRKSLNNSIIKIPRELFERLSVDELKAVFLHELAHLKFNHKLWRENFFHRDYHLPSVILFLIFIIDSIFSSNLFSASVWFFEVVPSSLLLGLSIFFYLLGVYKGYKRNHKQEFQADLYAKREMEGEKTVISCLEKIDSFVNNLNLDRITEIKRKIPTHPDLDDRKENLREEKFELPN